MIDRKRMTAGRMLCLGLGIAAATALIAIFFVSADPAAAQDTGTVEGRQPIVSNQFTTTGAGAIANRRPGLYIQQGIAVHDGDTSYFTGVPDEEPSFYADTFDQLFQQTLTSISSVLDMVNAFVQSLGSGGSSGGITFIAPGNSVTTWQSGSVSVP